jgi:hypothetical protein
MSGAVGLLDGWHPYCVPPERLVENHACAAAGRLHREDLLAPGTSATLQCGERGYQLATHERGKIWIGEQLVAIGMHPSMPVPAFICPQCETIRYKLFEVGGRWACYRCQGLTHASRHVNRMVPNYHRLKRLRRKINAPPEPFSPIAPRPKSHVRYHRVVAQIRELETRLLHHLRHDVNDVIEKRKKRRGE